MKFTKVTQGGFAAAIILALSLQVEQLETSPPDLDNGHMPLQVSRFEQTPVKLGTSW